MRIGDWEQSYPDAGNGDDSGMAVLMRVAMSTGEVALLLLLLLLVVIF